MIGGFAEFVEIMGQSVDTGDTETHYGMADAARTATAGHSTQQAARSCDESAKPGADKEMAKTVARRFLGSTSLRSVEALLIAATRNDLS